MAKKIKVAGTEFSDEDITLIIRASANEDEISLCEFVSRKWNVELTTKQAAKLKDAADKVQDAKTDLWLNDSIQFPRLLAEINAIGLSNAFHVQLSESMGIELAAIEQLFDRAENRFAEIKKSQRYWARFQNERPAQGWKLDKDGWYVRKIDNNEWSKGLSFYKDDRQGEGFITSGLRAYARTKAGCIDFDKFVKG